jgi:putative oxidoreductase
MKILILVARIMLGLPFFIFGLLKLFPNLHPMPMPTGDAGMLMGLMFVHGWLRMVGAAEVASGLLLLSGRFVPLALTIIGGIGLNILYFHFAFEPSGIYLPLFLAILEVILVFAYREYFRGVFAGKATPVWRENKV